MSAQPPAVDAAPEAAGRVVSVQGPVVDVRLREGEAPPPLYEVLLVETLDARTLKLEVIEHIEATLVRCIALSATRNLMYGTPVRRTGGPLEIPVGPEVFGRILDVTGEAIDGQAPIRPTETRPIRRPRDTIHLNPDRLTGGDADILETGIKMIDLLFPLVKGSKTGIVGGAALGKSILTLELIHNVVDQHEGVCVFTGAGERIREGNELYFDFVEQNIVDKIIMAFGQMDEPPGARYEIAFTGVTLAEHQQEQNKDVLFFIDNVFRFVQAGAEMSTLLGRVPSETGYQPTLASEVSEFHERIRSTASGSVTAIEAVYVPADDLTDPAVVAIFSYLDSIMVLSRERIQLGLYPAVDPLLSSSAHLEPGVVGRDHFQTAQEVLRMLHKYEELRRVVTVIGVEELSKSDRVIYERARRLQNFLTQPFHVAEAYTGKSGAYVSIAETVSGCDRIISGRLDKIEVEAFYMIGSIDQASG